MNHINHIIMYEYDDGKKLDQPISWCNKNIDHCSVAFKDLQHYALATAQGSVWGTPVCQDCVRSAIKIMGAELDTDHAVQVE